MKNILELERVSKRFGRNVALDNVSYEVAPGTVFALLGENGAGKTTTIRILLGLTDADMGRAAVLGYDSGKDDLIIRKKVGYVPEQPVLYDWMSVAEIGQFTAAFYPNGFWQEYCRQVEQYELPPGAKIKSLSKGMRAKVSLALALAHDPELLILDEPTSGLDAMVRREFLESMVDRAAAGKSVFLSSHQLGEVERVADTVAIMKKSKVVVVEPLEVLKSTTNLVTVTLTDAENRAKLTVPFKSVIEERVNGREVQILGRYLNPAAQNMLQSDQNITRFEIRTPSLEEIFIAYMGKDCPPLPAEKDK
ncbi:MAG: ABC transporter ATP-binding protein [Planctomycetaceae bacterium]|jgi:ABC-2 type transport system ATP-binding protein|nr:ABC transporter ATP-binding protein [Planctomycetaceae bacterium]